jgi:hypothetical protein
MTDCRDSHPVGRRKRGEPQDHRHRLRTIKAYDYQDGGTLLVRSSEEYIINTFGSNFR